MKPQLSSQHDYKYLPINCPNCRFEGKIQIGRLDRTFLCKHCKKSFHVDPDGVVVGERPPEEEEVSDYVAPLPPPKPSLVERLWAKLPSAGQMGIAGAVFLLSVAWFIHWIMTPAVVLPESLDQRAMIMAKSIVTGDTSTAKKLMTSGTTWDGGNWVKNVRTKTGKDLKEATVEQKYKERDGGLEKCGMILDIATMTGNKIRHTVVMSHWVRDEEMKWLLDGTRSLKDLSER